MKFTGYHTSFEYHFGKLYCYENYVIGHLNGDFKKVDTSVAEVLLRDIKKCYGNGKVVYISNREFSHDVDPEVYKLVDPKKLVGIAVVAEGQEQRVQAATEQSMYAGSFGFFDNLDSAVSWAQSFAKNNATG
ncbi:MAG: thymidylate synthase [Nonlabens sp.]